MLSIDQEKWVNQLSDSDIVVIVPYDPSVNEKFKKIREKIQLKLGRKTAVLHRGASGFGISGQDEMDVYIPVPGDRFDYFVTHLTELFGKPGSFYPLERAKFETKVDGKLITVFLMNESSVAWINGIKFDEYLKSHPLSLEEYRKLKEQGNGLSTRQYYRRKLEFINRILERIKG